MSEWDRPITVEAMYGPWGIDHDDIDAALDRSRAPRSSTMLYDAFADLDIGPSHVVLDVGARNAVHSLRIAERFGCRVVAVDPIEINVRDARAAIAEHGSGSLLDVRQGSIEAIPAADGEFDAVLSRDMLNHVVDIDGALDECGRVLAPGGAMVVYQTFATPLLEPAEAAHIYAGLAIVPERMSAPAFEEAARRAGLTVEVADPIGSEWREAWEEDGSGLTSRQLLHAARLLPKREELLHELGEVPYRVQQANTLWACTR